MRKDFKREEEIKEELTGQQAEDEKFEQIISNSYIFGQFMLMHMILKIQKLKGNEAVFKFIKKKYVDMGKANTHFLTQAMKNDELIIKYYEDTLQTKF